MPRAARLAGWWAQDYLYAAWWQVRGSLAAGDPDRFRSGTARPVVALPGVWEPWGFLTPLLGALHAAGHPVHVVPELGRNARPVPESARIVADLLASRDLCDVVLVAHSKGGLIGKEVMTTYDPQRRVSAMAAVCTPFRGSRYARHLPLASLRAFSPTDPTTRRLHAAVGANPRITAIRGVFDPHIPDDTTLPGAAVVVVDDGGHFRLLSHPDVIAAVTRVAAGGPAATSPMA